MIIAGMSTTSSNATVAGAARLAHWGVIRASGADAAAFLHGQLTQDVEHLAPDAARLAGYCSPKGRLLASFVVWRPSPEEVMLACSADLLPTVLRRLSMFVLRARCKLVDASAELALWGVAGHASREALGAAASIGPWQHATAGAAHVVRLPDAEGQPRWLWAATPSGAPALPTLGVDTWDALEVRAGIARIVARTADQFVPQMLNYEAVGGVDFRKGCYPGQEVVARSQYRGTIKRRALRFDTDAEASPGDEVFAAGDPSQPAGMVANAAREAVGSVLLVELKLAATGDALHLRGPDGPRLRPAALPYEVPSEA